MIKIMSNFALFGFVLSLAVHASTFLCINLQESFPYMWILHSGIFIVFIPTIFQINKYQKNDIDKFFKKATKYAPGWMKVFCVLFFVYAIVNFSIFLGFMSKGSPNIIDGKYVLSNHGKIYKYIDEAEYTKYKIYEVRGISGHWMIFYLLSATVMYSAFIEKKKSEEHK